MPAIADDVGRATGRRVKSLLRSICPRSVLMWREALHFLKYGEVELGLVEHLCRPDSASIDVGANEGGYVHWMRRYSQHVYAFEPVPWLADMLASKFPRGVTVENMALSSVHGRATLEIPLTAGGMITGLSTLNAAGLASYPERLRIEVTVAPLDDICSGEIGFIKIDVEGHEQAVLDGARKTMARCHPRLLVEIEARGVDDVARTLARLDYRGYFVREQRLEPIDRFDGKSMQRPEDIAGFSPGVPRKSFTRYINNFLFFPGNEPESTFRRIETSLRRA